MYTNSPGIPAATSPTPKRISETHVGIRLFDISPFPLQFSDGFDTLSTTSTSAGALVAFSLCPSDLRSEVFYNALRMRRMGLRIGGFATLLQVFDLPTSLAVYRDVLGFDVVS